MGGIAFAVLLISTAPSWAGKNPPATTVYNVQAFVIPTDYAERLELVGFPGSLPVIQAIDLNSRVQPVFVQKSSTKFHVSGKNCWIKDGILRASDPAVCRVTAARAGNTFSPITVLSAPTFFYFGTIPPETINQSLPLPVINVPTPTLVISNDPTSASAGQSITLTTVGGQGSGAVTFRVIGNYDPACVLVGNLLTKSAYGTCMVRATKAADGVYGAQNSQNIVFTFYGSTPQDPLMVDTSSPTSSLGNTITLSTTGGSGAGGVTYVIVGGDGVGTITGNKLSASSAGTFLIVATKQGDPQYASIVSSTAVFTFTG